MVSKTLPSLKSILEPFLSSLRSTWLLFTDFLGSVSCNSSSFNSQKSRVLLSSRCLIFKVLALSISFSLSASLERLTILPHSLQFVKHFFRIFFVAFFVHRSGSDFQPLSSEFFELSLERSDIIPHPPLNVNTFFRVFSNFSFPTASCVSFYFIYQVFLAFWKPGQIFPGEIPLSWGSLLS